MKIVVYEFYNEKNQLVLKVNNTEKDFKSKIEDYFGYTIGIMNYELIKYGYIRKNNGKERIRLVKKEY